MLSAETVSVRLERLESDVSKIKLLLQKLTREDRENLSFLRPSQQRLTLNPIESVLAIHIGRSHSTTRPRFQFF